MPKVPDKKLSPDDILNKWIEGYKIDPAKYREKLVVYIYSAWINTLSVNEEYQKFPLSYLCDFDVNRVIDEMVYGKEIPKEKFRFNFLNSLLTEAEKYYKQKEHHLCLLLYVTYIEHWFNDLINCLVITKDFEENETKKLIGKFDSEIKLNFLLPLFDLPKLNENLRKDIIKMFELRNNFVHYKWKANDDNSNIRLLQEFADYSKKAPKIIEELNKYVKDNIYNEKILKIFFKNLIYQQSGIILK
jgi:hypothetical protein